MRVIEVPPLRALRLVAIAAAALALVGCSTTPNRAPVEDRMATPRATVTAASPAVSRDADVRGAGQAAGGRQRRHAPATTPSSPATP